MIIVIIVMIKMIVVIIMIIIMIMMIIMIGTTTGALNADAAVLCWAFAQQAAICRFTSLNWPIHSATTGSEVSSFTALRGRLNLRFRARIAAALCRACGSRGLPTHHPRFTPTDDVRSGRLRRYRRFGFPSPGLPRPPAVAAAAL